MDDFEKRIQQQSLRQLPPEWREEILSTANAADHRAPDATPRLSTINYQPSTLLWPCPQAWAGLAAIWVLIFVLKLSTRDELRVAGKTTPVSREVITELRQQKLFFAELVGTTEWRDAKPRKSISPGPRSDRRFTNLAA